jgi:hypothetical protein
MPDTAGNSTPFIGRRSAHRRSTYVKKTIEAFALIQNRGDEMKAFSPRSIMLLAALFLFFGHGTASAQATRTWVSGVGDDANPCSRTAPCKTFAGAISKTAPSGEINCLDGGGFGAVTITKSITITCQAGTAGVLVAGGNAIAVNAPAGSFVQLKGLDINGLGTSSAGVAMLGAGLLAIEDCEIYGFTYGVYVNGPNGARVTIDNVKIRKNTNGVYVLPQASANNGVNIDHAIIDANATANLAVNTGATVKLSDSALTGSATAISYSGGTVDSYGSNRIEHTGAPAQSLVVQ